MVKRATRRPREMSSVEYRGLESEKSFQSSVLDLMDVYRWWHLHIEPVLYIPGGRTVPDKKQRGFTDLLFGKPGHGIHFAELKAEEGKYGEGQEMWRDRILAAGGTYHLWRPSDWNEIVKLISS